VHALTYGTSAVKQSLKDVLSRGPEKVYWIADTSAETGIGDPQAGVLRVDSLWRRQFGCVQPADRSLLF
jgi:hypothetical protein